MENKEDIIINVAMEIILHAGDGRNFCQQALDSAKKGNFEEANKFLLQAKENITLAHRAQTGVIQEEANGEKFEVPLLFIHAQDTLMTIMSEVNMIKEMVSMYELIFKEMERR